MRDDGGCGFFRCLQPAKYIKYMGLAETETILRTPTDEQLLSADLIVLQDIGSPVGSKIAKFLLQNKIPYVTDVDDFLHHVSPRNTGGYPAWNPGTLYVSRAMEVIKSSFGLTVSTNALAREYFPYNPTIYVVPNYLDKFVWDQPTVRKQDGKIRIGWCGGNAHGDDLFMISKVLERLIKENKGKVVFETMGMLPQELKGVFPMQHTGNDSCPSCGFEGQLHHFPGESLENYPGALISRGWDIAVAPVIDNSFGNCKSDLKIKEYAAAGVPMVVSSVTPYREAKRNGAQILLAETYEEWYTNLKALIDNQSQREEMAQKNKEWVTQYWIQDNAQHIFEAYAQVLAKANIVFRK